MIKKYLEEISSKKPLSKEEEKRYLKLAKNGDNKAYNKVLESNLKFVVSIARQYQNQGIDLDDLIAEGNYGLVKAFAKFDIKREFKFITYAVWWVRQAILSAIHSHSKLIRLPGNKIANVTKISKAKQDLEQSLTRIPTYEELEEFLNDTKVLNDLGFNYTIIGLHTPFTENNKDLTDVIPANLTSEELEVKQKQFMEEFNELLKSFPERDKKILCLYYGIGEIRPYTLKEIGIEVCLTRERVRQIKEEVLKKLRKKKQDNAILRDFL